ncbi:MAG: polyphosphate kinase 2 family protein [Pseudomonadota bacterium]
MDYAKQFIVKPGSKVDLGKIDAGYKDSHESHEEATPEIEAYRDKLRDLQFRLYAEEKRSLLICLQALDAAGKDGTVNHVLSAMNPQGCRAYGFKQPSAQELAHDFLWRIHKAAPAKGEVAIFNRSHYEDVLVVRVHDLVPKSVWSKRYDLINDFEQLLVDNGTHVVKFFLHISEDEQLRRFKQRIDDPARNWKISDADYRERSYWTDYQTAYEEALSKCSTEHAPWYVIPANHKWFRNLAVSEIIVKTLDAMDPKIPAPSVDLDAIKKQYHAAEVAEKDGKV